MLNGVSKAFITYQMFQENGTKWCFDKPRIHSICEKTACSFTSWIHHTEGSFYGWKSRWLPPLQLTSTIAEWSRPRVVGKRPEGKQSAPTAPFQLFWFLFSSSSSVLYFFLLSLLASSRKIMHIRDSISVLQIINRPSFTCTPA